MGRLKTLRPTLGALPSTLAYAPKDEQERDRFRGKQHWRKWYSTARWRKLRWAVLVRDRFTCQRCGKLEGNTSQLVADHKRKHGGNEARFFDMDGIETLCAPCHNSAKQKLEHGHIGI